MHIFRHLEILVASFPEPFLPDHIAELKWDHFYGGLLKQFKAVVEYLKARQALALPKVPQDGTPKV